MQNIPLEMAESRYRTEIRQIYNELQITGSKTLQVFSDTLLMC